MSEKIDVEDKAATTAASAEDPKGDNKPEEKSDATPKNPVAEEIKKIKSGEGKSELEKAIYSRKKIDERIALLGGTVQSEEEEEPDLDAPLTLRELKKLEAQRASTTSIAMAEEQITDPDDLALTKHYLQTRVIPSGNPAEDLKFARSAVNALKNAQIAEEIQRKGSPSNTNPGGGAPAREVVPFTPTAEEASMMRPPWNLSEKDVLKARKESEAQRQS